MTPCATALPTTSPARPDPVVVAAAVAVALVEDRVRLPRPPVDVRRRAAAIVATTRRHWLDADR